MPKEPGIKAARGASFDEQLWPIQSGIIVLAAFLVGIILALANFEEQRLLFNGYTYLVAVGLIAALLIGLSFRLKDPAARPTQLCILASLMMHAGIACLVIRFPLPIDNGVDVASLGSEVESPEENIAPDYHWSQAEEPDMQQDFQKPVDTAAPDAPPVEARLKPRSVDQSPVVTASKPPTMEITPLGTGSATGAGGQPAKQRFHVRRSTNAVPEKVDMPEALAMARQRGKDIDLAAPVAEMPALPADKPAEPEKTPQITEEAKVFDAVVGPRPGQAHPRTIARSGNESGQQLPGDNVVAQLPSQDLPGGSQRRDRTEFTATIDRQTSVARSDRNGHDLPSTVIADAGLTPKAAAAVGGSPGSRIEKSSAVAVERSDNAQAPNGPLTAASGSQDFATGSGLIAARMGSPDARGERRPGSTQWSTGDPAELRYGAANSFLVQGASLPNAAARKAQASQPDGAGHDLSPSQSATLRRSQSADGIQLPVASLAAVAPVVVGAGGMATNPGGETSQLEQGPAASVGRMSAADVPRSALGLGNGNRVGPGATAADALPASGGASRAAPFVAMAGIPRGIGRGAIGSLVPEQGADDSVQRSQTGNVNLDAQAENPAGVQGALAQTSAATQRGASGSAPQPTSSLGPATGLGTDRLNRPEQDPGPLTPTHSNPSQIEGMALAPAPETRGTAAHRAGVGEGDLGEWISGAGQGRARLGRNGSGLSLDGSVKEPTEFYRRRANMRHGIGIGDGDGSGFTEPAVELGLEYFSRVQFPDGHWSLDKLPKGLKVDSPGLGSMEADTAATGLSLLGYLGAGYTHLDEKHRDSVRRGLEWLIQHQKPDGDLFTGGNEYTQFYSHGMATMALCEAYGMTQDPDLREPAQRAIGFIVRAQDPNRGGWRYRANVASDTSVTGWQLMALKSAQMAGLDVPEATFRKIGDWLDRAQGPEPGTYVYNPWNPDSGRDGRLPSPTMTAEAMLMRMYMGRRRDAPDIIHGADYVRAHLPEVGTVEHPQRNAYYWYYATQAMYQMGGDYWKTWNGHIGPLVKAGQVQEGPLRGSWHPTEPVKDKWGEEGGRLFVTSMHMLMLEVYYRHLPLFQELSK